MALKRISNELAGVHESTNRQQINQNFEEIEAALAQSVELTPTGLAIGGAEPTVEQQARVRAGIGFASAAVDFSQAVPLGNAMTVMRQKTVAGALTFSASAGANLFSNCHVRMVADGTNTPDFSAFSEYGNSAGWDNTSGIINHVDFWFDGVTYWYSVQQAANAVAAVMPTVVSATITSASPSELTVVFAASLNVSAVPAVSDFVITNSGGADAVTAVEISGSTVTLTKSRATLGSDILTVSYVAPASGALVSTDGIEVSSFSDQAVNNQLSLQFARLSTLAGYTESGDAGAGYTYTATANNLTTTLATNANVGLDGDGYVEARVTGSVAATNVFFLDDANDATNYTGNILGIQTNGAGAAYLIARTGAANVAANGTATLAAINDLVRIERAGTNGYVKVSKDDGETWVTVHTLASISASRLYPKCNGGPIGIAWGPISAYGAT